VQYATTRNSEPQYNWLDALSEDRAPDGGFFVPGQMPEFTEAEIRAFAMKNPNQAVAEILNLFFGTELNRWDIDFYAGRYPVRLNHIVRRIAVAEMWHNCDWEFSRTVRDLAALVRGVRDTDLPIGTWFRVALRIGVLFGIFGELMRDGIADLDKKVDVSLPSGDGTALAAAWFARQMGLPIGDIIICCNENNNLWNLLRQGELKLGLPPKATCTPDCDRLFPDTLELLLWGCGGREEAVDFAACEKNYRMGESALNRLRTGIYVSVAWEQRVQSTIPAIYHNSSYVFGPYSALCYAGLTDYRSRTGSGSWALLLSERGALRDDGFVAGCLNMAVQTLHNIL
jgi:threonine synthase